MISALDVGTNSLGKTIAFWINLAPFVMDSLIHRKKSWPLYPTGLEKTKKWGCWSLLETLQFYSQWIMNQLFTPQVVRLRSLLRNLQCCPPLFNPQWRLLLFNLQTLLLQNNLWPCQTNGQRNLPALRHSCHEITFSLLQCLPVDSQHLMSETPFLAPATRPEAPVAVDAQVKSKSVDYKDKKTPKTII